MQNTIAILTIFAGSSVLGWMWAVTMLLIAIMFVARRIYRAHQHSVDLKESVLEARLRDLDFKVSRQIEASKDVVLHEQQE